MFPKHRASQVAVFLVAALSAVACQRTQALEDIPEGTDITIELKDGQRITGRLVGVDTDTVAVTGRGAGGVRVSRTDVAAVRSGDASRKPALREVVIPAGAPLDARLETTVASGTSSVEDPVRAILTSPLVADGITIAPTGSTLLGTVTSVRTSGRVKGRAAITLQFDRLQARAVTYDIRTAPLRFVADATKGDDAAKIGIGAIAGAVVGGITGGGKGAAVGSAVGAGGGSAVVLATKGDEITLASGSSLRVTLAGALSVTVPARTGD